MANSYSILDTPGKAQMAGATTEISPTVTVSTSPAYSAGDVIGGLLTLSNITRSSLGALLQNIFVSDTSNQSAAMDLLIFNANPASSTFTDNAAVSIATADVSKIIRCIPIASTDYTIINSKGFVDLTLSGRTALPSSGTDLYAVLIAVGTPTYATTTALTLRIGVVQD